MPEYKVQGERFLCIVEAKSPEDALEKIKNDPVLVKDWWKNFDLEPEEWIITERKKPTHQLDLFGADNDDKD